MRTEVLSSVSAPAGGSLFHRRDSFQILFNLLLAMGPSGLEPIGDIGKGIRKSHQESLKCGISPLIQPMTQENPNTALLSIFADERKEYFNRDLASPSVQAME